MEPTCELDQLRARPEKIKKQFYRYDQYTVNNPKLKTPFQSQELYAALYKTTAAGILDQELEQIDCAD